jgi:hypothetical protein
MFVKWLRERRKRAVFLNLLEIWILLVLKAAGTWVRTDKIMIIIFLLEKVYGLAGACFVRGRIPWSIPWSGDVVNALRRLTSLGLVEELPQGIGAYRLTENGRTAVERYSMSDPKIRYPYADAKFFIEWDMDALAEYIRVNYPEWA